MERGGWRHEEKFTELCAEVDETHSSHSGPPGIPSLWRFADISHRWLTFSQHVDEGVNDIPPVRGQMILDSHSTESPSSRGMLTPRWQGAAQAVKCVFRGCFGRNNRGREIIKGKLKLRIYIIYFCFYPGTLVTTLQTVCFLLKTMLCWTFLVIDRR